MTATGGARAATRPVRGRRARVWAAIVVASSLTAPTAAGAATLAVGSSCFRPGEEVGLRAEGFTPRGWVAFEYRTSFEPLESQPYAPFRVLGVAPADEAGTAALAFTGEDQTMSGMERAPLRFIAIDYTDPSVLAEADAAQTIFTADLRPWIGSTAPPRAMRRLRVLGFTGSERLHAHLLHRGRLRSSRDLGPVTPPCGELDTRVRLFRSSNPRPGRWTLQIDPRSVFSRSTRPAIRFRFLVARTARGSRLVHLRQEGLPR